MSIRKQTTIQTEQTLVGKGLHVGKNVTITFKPAPENTGYVFIRKDIEGAPQIQADISYVTDTLRGVTLEKNGAQINTTEHVLAAATGLEIDNLYIEIDAPEPPIMDGSSRSFIEILEKCGLREQEAFVDEFVVKEIISYKDDKGGEIILMPCDTYQIIAMVDFGTEVLATQNAVLNDISDFKNEIAPARTFSFLHDIESLLEQNLIKGGDLDNAIIYVDKEISDKASKKLREIFNQKNTPVKLNSILNNVTLYWNNEAARHKLLDVVGDLALIGTKIRGKVIANKPGHAINVAFGKKVQNIIKKQKRTDIPKFDLSKPPLMDICQIMDILPHRYPFLLIDKVLELTENHVVAVKNITMNEPFFMGHFPGSPVMPGVLQIEGMAQCGGILVLSTVPDPENYLTYFAKIDGVRFKQKVFPGDTLIFKGDLLSPIRRGICHMKTYAYASGKLVSEAELTAQIIKVKNN